MKQKLSTMQAGEFAGFLLQSSFLGGGAPPALELEEAEIVMIIVKMDSYDQIYRDHERSISV